MPPSSAPWPSDASAESSGVALVTTAWLRERARGSRHVQVLDAFLLYHAAVGVDLLMVFLDGDENEQPIARELHEEVQELIAQGRVELFYREGCNGVRSQRGERMGYAQGRLSASLRSGAASDVASRQMLHAETAMRRCVALNRMGRAGQKPLRWLLHLDLDELLFCEGSSSDPSTLHDLVRALDADGVHQLTLVNYEAVPTRHDGNNYFVSTTRFKRHAACIGVSPDAQRAVHAWQSRSPYKQYFLFYDNGKSLVRVPETWNDEVVPASVHHWKTPRTWRTATNFYDPRRTDVATVWREPSESLRCCVLHYPVCGLDWLSDKYKRLGAFPDVWGGTKNLPIPPCFHLQARDAALNGHDALQTLYERQVVVSEDRQDFWNMQLRAGVCEEITFPRDLLVRKGFSLPEDAGGPQATSDKAGDAPQAPPRPSGLSVEKAWLLAAISSQYLQQPDSNR